MSHKNQIETHPTVVRFLDAVSSHIRGAERKVEVRDEILSHLEAELKGVDVDFEKRLQLAIGKFGDPMAFSKSLYRAQRTWPETVIKYSTLGLLLALALTYVTSTYFIGRYQNIISNTNSIIASRISRFLAAQTELSRVSFLSESSYVSADAGAFLNSRIPWSDRYGDVEFVIPNEKGREWGKNWISSDLPTELKAVNLTWIHRLKEFDHWDLFNHGPNSRLVGEKAEIISPYSYPLIDFSFLYLAAKVHLRRGLDKGEPTEALQDIRHLARLVYSTETLVGSMSAISLLKIEREAFDEALRRDLPISNEYQPLSVEVLRKMKTTLWVAAGFADHAAPEVMAKVFLDPKSKWPVGSCAALAESAQSIVLTTDLLKKKYPFEKEMNQEIDVARQVFEASRPFCRLRFHRRLISHTDEYTEAIMGFTDYTISENSWGSLKNYQYFVGRHLPYVRQSIGMELMAVARPDFSGLYDRE